jgi:hypothetical protein
LEQYAEITATASEKVRTTYLVSGVSSKNLFVTFRGKPGLLTMTTCWSSPTTKHAYRLSWASLLVTILVAIAGFGLGVVSISSLFSIRFNRVASHVHTHGVPL